MLIVYGTKVFKKDLGEYQKSGTCPNCNYKINLHVIRVMKWATLYWIPLIPYSIKRYKICPICNAAAEITKQEAEDLLSGNI
ncbi:MAG: zinc-ribbon domain-containing protein [Treponema sp.]|uniref:hypothetical protein n=1 Tax=Treponema sp. TaxID=166 RepID=UPI001B456D53|nr:hypothetical protein [Treponema sp.]MBP5402265.1 zinc-ribbon domain-containing protein [Treponema sp.]MBR5933237.1 zinc-ribbon domain-containing protein [Treponema sp.]